MCLQPGPHVIFPESGWPVLEVGQHFLQGISQKPKQSQRGHLIHSLNKDSLLWMKDQML